MPQIEKAVIDRIVDGKTAVLLVGDGERKLYVPKMQLPKGAKEGDWLKVETSNGELANAVIDAEETQRHKGRIAGLMEKLRRKSGMDGQW